MTAEDVRIIFSNVAEIAEFADEFTELLEDALGSVVEGGNGVDHVGALFLEMVSWHLHHELHSLSLVTSPRSP